MKSTITESKRNGPRKPYTADTRTTSANNIHVDIEASSKWLTNADLFAETECFLTATQDQVILRRN